MAAQAEVVADGCWQLKWLGWQLLRAALQQVTAALHDFDDCDAVKEWQQFAR